MLGSSLRLGAAKEIPVVGRALRFQRNVVCLCLGHVAWKMWLDSAEDEQHSRARTQYLAGRIAAPGAFAAVEVNGQYILVLVLHRCRRNR